jgi:hypothetical protein
MAKGLQGCKTHLQRGDLTTATNFADVAYIQSSNGPSQTRAEIDVTTIDSPACTREFDPGLKDGGSVDLTLLFNPLTQTSHDDILDDFDDEVTRFWRVKLDGDTQAHAQHFPAFVTSTSGPQITPDGDVTMAVTLKVAGPITRSTIAI